MNIERMQRRVLALKDKGYRNLNPSGFPVMVKLCQKGHYICGSAYVFSRIGFAQFKAAVDLIAIRDLVGIQAIGQVYPGYVTGADIIGASGGRRKRRFRKVMRRMGKKFKRQVNTSAKRLAKAKVLQQLRSGWAKVLESPIGTAAVKAGAQALSAFGVPAPVAEMALNQVRYSTADRARQGGHAALLATASSGKGGFKEAMRIVARRQGKSLKKSIPSIIPGLASAPAGTDVASILSAAQTLGVGGEDYLPKDYDNAYLRGFYGV